ncbi:hypothetical protein SCAR479_11317 [Seiridium cardinale]|uniref:Uncharacterized protein n=1 Tax=Seiridium cardinale TaxID=138064 RepID=A0ABR2XDW5_9PEZI
MKFGSFDRCAALTKAEAPKTLRAVLPVWGLKLAPGNVKDDPRTCDGWNFSAYAPRPVLFWLPAVPAKAAKIYSVPLPNLKLITIKLNDSDLASGFEFELDEPPLDCQLKIPTIANRHRLSSPSLP